MKNLLLLIFLLACTTTSKAQKLSGLWYSADSSRIYEIKETAPDQFIAVIKSSDRKTDSIGYMVLQNLIFNKRKKRYEGAIYAVTNGQPAFVKIKFHKHDINKIVLKINRMFVMDVAINWVRAEV
jgi:hypothetical protein